MNNSKTHLPSNNNVVTGTDQIVKWQWKHLSYDLINYLYSIRFMVNDLTKRMTLVSDELYEALITVGSDTVLLPNISNTMEKPVPLVYAWCMVFFGHAILHNTVLLVLLVPDKKYMD